MHSVKPDKPILPALIELLSYVDRAAHALDLRYFVGGAFARDLVLVHVHGYDTPRPTRDVDVGIGLRHLDDFHRLKKVLIETRKFRVVSEVPQRLRFTTNEESRGIPLDILPFPIDGSVEWPKEKTVVIELPGFDDALRDAKKIRISQDLVIPVASIPGQTLLKLAAWVDRGRLDPKDAIDLLLLIRRYADAGNEGRLYEERLELLEEAEFDIERAGAMLLGEDTRTISSPQTYRHLLASFTPETVQGRLLTQVSSGYLPSEDNRVARAQILLTGFFDTFSRSA